MREIIDRILELESKATPYFTGGFIPINCEHDRKPERNYSGDWISIGGRAETFAQARNDSDFICEVRNNIRPMLLRMKALEDVAEVAKKMRMRNFGRIDELYSVLDKLDETEGMDGATNKT